MSDGTGSGTGDPARSEKPWILIQITANARMLADTATSISGAGRRRRFDPGAGELVYGLIFWFRWNKFPGSYFLLIATSRS
jgi:hypothetical protein